MYKLHSRYIEPYITYDTFIYIQNTITLFCLQIARSNQLLCFISLDLQIIPLNKVLLTNLVFDIFSLHLNFLEMFNNSSSNHMGDIP